MEGGAQPVRHPVPRPLSGFNILKKEKHETVAYTEDRTLPANATRADILMQASWLPCV